MIMRSSTTTSISQSPHKKHIKFSPLKINANLITIAISSYTISSTILSRKKQSLKFSNTFRVHLKTTICQQTTINAPKSSMLYWRTLMNFAHFYCTFRQISTQTAASIHPVHKAFRAIKIQHKSHLFPMILHK